MMPGSAPPANASRTADAASPSAERGTRKAASNSSRVALTPARRAGRPARKRTAWSRARSSRVSSTTVMLGTLCLQSLLVKYHNQRVTIWRPQIEHSGSRSIYEQIADRIEHDVIAGVLLHGSRLPTQRELADALGITTVTVTRAYREAARRGLLASTVGRGPFLRPAKRPTPAIDGEIDLSTTALHG